jgi:HSP90 family molecular chaperone
MWRFVSYHNKEQANAGKKDELHGLPPQTLEINPSHPLIAALYSLKDDPSSVANLVASQLLDNCLMAAGLVEDPRYMIPRLNDLLLATALHHKQESEVEAETGNEK